MKNLTDKEKRFVEEYVSNGYNAAKAFRSVFGPSSLEVSKVQGWKLINRKPHIQEAINASEKSSRQISRELNLDRKSILLELKKIIKGDYSARERLAGIHLLLKITGAYSPNKTELDINFSDKKKIDTTGMTFEEIQQLEYKIASEI